MHKHLAKLRGLHRECNDEPLIKEKEMQDDEENEKTWYFGNHCTGG